MALAPSDNMQCPRSVTDSLGGGTRGPVWFSQIFQGQPERWPGRQLQLLRREAQNPLAPCNKGRLGYPTNVALDESHLYGLKPQSFEPRDRCGTSQHRSSKTGKCHLSRRAWRSHRHSGHAESTQKKEFLGEELQRVWLTQPLLEFPVRSPS